MRFSFILVKQSFYLSYQTFILMKSSWRSLSSSSSEDVLIKTNIFVLVLHLQKTCSRRLQDALVKTNILNVFTASCKNVFKTSSRCLQDVFKTYRQVKLSLLTSLRDVFNTFLRRTAKMVIYRKIFLGHTSEKFMVSPQNLQE